MSKQRLIINYATIFVLLLLFVFFLVDLLFRQVNQNKQQQNRDYAQALTGQIVNQVDYEQKLIRSVSLDRPAQLSQKLSQLNPEILGIHVSSAKKSSLKVENTQLVLTVAEKKQSLVVDLSKSQFFAELQNFDLFQENYYFKIQNQKGQTIITNLEKNKDFKPIKVNFNVLPQTTWTLQIQPKYGWLTNFDYLALITFGFLLQITLFITIISIPGFNRKMKEKIAIMPGMQGDDLTMLPNKADFQEETAILDSKDLPYGLIYIDLNFLKSLNEAHGYAVGDRVLVETAQRVKHILKNQGQLYRLEGDDFVALIPQKLSPNAYQSLLEKIESHIQKELHIKGFSFVIDASLGYACYPKDGNTAEEILAAAGHQMHKEKILKHKG